MELHKIRYPTKRVFKSTILSKELIDAVYSELQQKDDTEEIKKVFDVVTDLIKGENT